MMDWQGTPIPPSRLQAIIRDSPATRGYGAGDRRRLPRSLAASIEDYLRARLAAPLGSLEEIIAFLGGCRYVKDREVFGRDEVWMHPEDFERTREGDCEDHALWAWVRLAGLGLDARFTAGLHEGGGHAWVTLYRPPGIAVCETTGRKSGRYLYEAGEAGAYEPVWSVDREARFYWHGPPS